MQTVMGNKINVNAYISNLCQNSLRIIRGFKIWHWWRQLFIFVARMQEYLAYAVLFCSSADQSLEGVLFGSALKQGSKIGSSSSVLALKRDRNVESITSNMALPWSVKYKFCPFATNFETKMAVLECVLSNSACFEVHPKIRYTSNLKTCVVNIW